MSIQPLKDLRKKVLEISHLGQDGNLQSVFSSMEILWTLYNGVLNCTAENCTSSDRDYFILSKGQATLGWCVVLAEQGFFSFDELKTFCQLESRFSMQVDSTKFSGGIENAAGSLGHGFPMAVGLAMACKSENAPSRIFTLVGDGEFNEGTMWEACLLAGGRQLNNLCVIIDDNNSVGSMLDMGDMSQKLEAFGFEVMVADGHNVESLSRAVGSPLKDKPRAVIAKTKRGYGSNTMMTDNHWFHRAPNAEELEILVQEVESF